MFLVSPIEVREEMWNNFHFFLKTLIDIIQEKNKDQKVVIICNSENAKNNSLLSNSLEELNFKIVSLESKLTEKSKEYF